MVKIYHSYEFLQTLGQAVSKSSNFVYDSTCNVFIAGVNQYVCVISAKSGEVIHYFFKEDKNIGVRCVCYHHGNIYAGFEDGQIIVWELQTRQQLHIFDLHKSTVSCIRVAGEDNKMISAGLDANIIIWDLLSEECSTIKSAHLNSITQIEVLQICMNGKPITVILSIGKDGFFRVWNLQNRLCLAALSCQVTETYSMHVDPDQGLVYVGTNKEDIVIIAFSKQGVTPLCEIRGVFKKKSYGRCEQIVEEHDIMYILSSDKMLESYRILSPKQLQERKKKVIARKKKRAPEQAESKIDQIQISLKLIDEKGLPFKVHNLAVLDGRVLLNNGTNLYDLSTQKELTHATGRTQQVGLQYPFMFQRTLHTIHIYHQASIAKLFSIPEKVTWCCLFNAGYLIVAADSVKIWDLAKNQQVYELEQKWSGCWARKNKCLLWRENQLGIFQVGLTKKKSILMKNEGNKLFEQKINEAMYQHSFGKYIVSLQNVQIHIQYADTNRNFLKLHGHKLPILSFDLSSDDAILATGSVDKDIRFWDMDFGHSIKTIFAHQEAVTTVRFIHDTHYLLSGSRDGHIKFWDADTTQLIMDLQENILEVKSVAVSETGDLLIAGGLDGGLRVWKQTGNQTIATDIQEQQFEKVMIEDYAKTKLDKYEEKTRYEDLKHGEEIIEALESCETPKTLIGLIRRIPPGNLKSSLSFLHSSHRTRLEAYIKLMVGQGYEQQVCWRVLKELDQGSELGRSMRMIWRPINSLIQSNHAGLSLLLKAIKQQNDI